MWNPDTSWPEALETHSASLSESTAGVPQLWTAIQQLLIANFMYIRKLQQLKKLYLVFLPAQKEKGKEQHL